MKLRPLLIGMVLPLALVACTPTKPLETKPTGSGTNVQTHLSFAQVLQSAEKGDKYAQFELGTMYYAGDGVDQDKTKAVEWYVKAAAQGNHQASFNLGILYKTGDGVKKDLESAHGWFVRASDQGDVRGAFQLGTMSYQGLGTEKDLDKAFAYFRKAAMGGLAEAQLNIAVMDIKGEGTAQNLPEAYAWLTLAKEGENLKAADFLTKLTSQISDDVKKQGEARLKELRKTVKKNGG